MADLSEDDILKAAKRWQDQQRAKIEKRNEFIGIHASHDLQFLLKPLEKEVKKRERHPLTNWQEVWSKTVGEELSAMSRVKNFRNGFLEIEVDNAALKSELESFYSEELTATLKEELPTKKLRALKFILSGK